MNRKPCPQLRPICTKEQAECVQQVRQYLVEHLDSHVTQAELAQRYHISLTSLKGAFKQVYGLPINTYLRRCRVQHAEQLLFTTDLSILEIAQRVGYDSPSRFAAMFKREKGITRGNAAACAPTSCRKKNDCLMWNYSNVEHRIFKNKTRRHIFYPKCTCKKCKIRYTCE